MSEKTIALSGAETEVHFSGGNAWLRNDGASTVYAAKTAGVTAGADGVISIPAGGSAPVYGANGAVFLLGSGSVQLIGSDYATNPFVGDSFGGGADITANAAEMVTLDGLQGGVPFSEMVVSGKNLIPYPYSTNHTPSGIDYAVNDDGTIKMNGTANAISYFTVSNQYAICLKKGVSYVLSSAILSGTADLYEIVLQWTNKSGNQSYRGINSTTSKTVVITPDDDIWCRMWIRVYSGNTVDCTISFQLECNVTPTAYEPPITGRELTIHACGKNLIKYPYKETTKTVNGLTFTNNGDGSVTVNGTAENSTDFLVASNLDIRKGNYILSGCPLDGSNSTYKIQAYGDTLFNSDVGIMDIGNGAAFAADFDFLIVRLQIRISKGTVCDNLMFRPQLEIGSTPTDFEKYSGAEYTIIPDSNPYTVPNDIRQQDGINNIMVSAGTVQVTGVRRDAALKRVWDKLDELTAAIIVSNGETAE